MTEYSKEELDKIIAENVAIAQNRQYIADNGVIGFTMALEYLGDQVNRKIIPQAVYTTMESIYKTFRVDIGLDPATVQPKEPDKTEDE